MTSTRECHIESLLVTLVKKNNGIVYKLAGANRDKPDRLVALPGMPLALVECKAPGEEPRPSQVVEFERLAKIWHKVWVVSTREEVERFIRAIGGKA